MDKDFIKKQAILDESQTFRYTFMRRWGDEDESNFVNFVLRSPGAIADETLDDSTIKRCAGYVKIWGYSGMLITNLFACRAYGSSDLKKKGCQTGGNENDEYIKACAEKAKKVVVGWGPLLPEFIARRKEVMEYLPNIKPLYCAGINGGEPIFPKVDADWIKEPAQKYP